MSESKNAFKSHDKVNDLETLSATDTFVGDVAYEPTKDDTSYSLQLVDVFPADDARPAQVRRYLTLVIHALVGDATPSGTTPSQLANKWEYGKGEELRTYDESDFQYIFGSELGAILAKDIKKRSGNQKGSKDETDSNLDMPWIGIFALFVACLFYGFMLGWALYGVNACFDSESHLAWRVVSHICLVPGWVAGLLMLLFLVMSIEENVSAAREEKRKKADVEEPLLA